MSGWYSVEIKKAFSDPNGQFLVEMVLDILDGKDIYEIKIDSNTLEIHKTKGLCTIGSGLFAGQPDDFRWIPKYLLRPNKIGKELFKIDPLIIAKLWGLVANKQRMRQLKQVPAPHKIKIQI